MTTVREVLERMITAVDYPVGRADWEARIIADGIAPPIEALVEALTDLLSIHEGIHRRLVEILDTHKLGDPDLTDGSETMATVARTALAQWREAK